MYKYTGMWQSLVLVAKEEGRRGLYAGMGTHVARVVSAKSAERLRARVKVFFFWSCVQHARRRSTKFIDALGKGP